MLNAELPRGRTRVSDAVIQKLAIAEAHSVTGVLDVRGIVVGTMADRLAAGQSGLEKVDSIDEHSAVAFSEGRDEQVATVDHPGFFAADHAKAIWIRLRLTASDGFDSYDLSGDVRTQVQGVIRRLAGVGEVVVDVEFVPVAPLH